MNTRVEIIEKLLRDNLEPTELQIIDNSAAHAGHPGAVESGGGHYKLHITSPKFNNLSLIEQHKLVYAAIGELIKNNTIHAVSMETKATD